MMQTRCKFVIYSLNPNIIFYMNMNINFNDNKTKTTIIITKIEK